MSGIISDWKRLDYFEESLKRAVEGGLPVEFFTDFLYEYRNGADVPEACAAALHEWDL